MKFEILGVYVEIRRAKRSLKSLTNEEVDELASRYAGRLTLKVARIKAARELAPGTKLVDAKTWVEEHFN